ncbi:M20/M25/M40 family metallo-hydrolase [Azospirillum sp. sgz302134]
MKGFVAAAMALVERASGRMLSQPLHLALSYDEEVGCLGVRRLIDMMAALPVRPRFCIVGEPTSMQVITPHKGKTALRIDCRGVGCRSRRCSVSACRRIPATMSGVVGRASGATVRSIRRAGPDTRGRL